MVRKQLLILATVFLFSIVSVSALNIVTTSNDLLKEGVIDFNVRAYNSSGMPVNDSVVTCQQTVYNSSGDIFDNSVMAFVGKSFTKTLNLSVGDYSIITECVSGVEGAHVERKVSVSPLGKESLLDGAPLAAIILIPIIFGFLLLFGANLITETHPFMSIFMFFISLLSVVASSLLGTQVAMEYYSDALSGLLSKVVFYIAMTFVIIFIYFMIYFIYYSLMMAKQTKKERLQY